MFQMHVLTPMCLGLVTRQEGLELNMGPTTTFSLNSTAGKPKFTNIVLTYFMSQKANQNLQILCSPISCHRRVTCEG